MDLLDDDRADRDDTWLDERTAALTALMRAEVTAWARTLRDGGSRAKAKSDLTWRHYVTDVVLSAPGPGDGHNLVTALRSLFRFLKRERQVFRDPTTRLPRKLTRRPT